MIRRALLLPDAHINETVPKEYQLVKRFIRKQPKWDLTLLMGDYMDISALCHWDMDKRKLMEGRRYKKEVDIANKELDFLQKHSKKIVYLEGNHENFVTRYIEKHPEQEGMIELPENLNLKERGIEWVPMNKLYKIGSCYFTHGLYTNKYHTNKHITTLGCNIVYGHKHSAQSDMMTMKMQKPIMGWALGCLCNKQPHYMKGRPSNWINGFGIFEWNEKSGHFSVFPINIINNKFIWQGKEYK